MQPRSSATTRPRGRITNVPATMSSAVARAHSEVSGQMDLELQRRKARAKGKGEKKEQEMEAKKKEIDIDEHNMTVEDVLNKYEVKKEMGLTQAQVDANLEKYGKNELTPPPSKPRWVLFLEQMTGFFSLLLWMAAFLCFIAYGLDQEQSSNLYLGIVLAVVVFMTGCFSFFQEAKSAAVMEGFKNFLPLESMVVRDGQPTKIPATMIVPGDIVLVNSGDKIPADFRVLDFSQFKVNNSSLTGESIDLKRYSEKSEKSPLEADNLAFYGTLCVDGKATGVVIRTADKTVIGTIANLAATTATVQTPIAIEIDHFIHIISAVAVVLGVTFLLIGVGKGTDAVANVVFCIGIIVANVPEGLLATVTVSLTLTAQRMAEKQVLVKNLESVETLGSTTVIASDKTGTLTQNRMTASHCWYNKEVHKADLAGKNPFDPNNDTFKRLQMIATLCNNAKFINPEANALMPSVLGWQTKGDASESALIKFCEAVTPIEDVRAQHPRICEIPFNSRNKYQVSINNKNGDHSQPRFVALKGAPERVWSRCSHVWVNGEAVPKDEVYESYTEAQEWMMGNGERVLGFCYRELDAKEYPEDYPWDIDEVNFPIEEGMVFVGLISLQDPPRPRVPPAVLNCQKAGIKVVMVTGDHPDTAEAIAKQVHIIRSKTRRDLARERGCKMDDVDPNDDAIEARVVTGTELLTMSTDELHNVLDYEELVFARTSPQQKLIIVKGLQSKQQQGRGKKRRPVRHVVAVTGDGVNDSPALKAANIGVAMGLTGSDVAKEAADMILLNDNFASIVDGVQEGRLIFDNLKKSIAYTLSSNIPEISPFLMNILVGIPLPLPTVLILCIDLGTDMVPAISLAYENKESNIMSKPPRDMRTERLVTMKLISFSYLQIGIIQALAGFYTYYVVMNDYGFHPGDLWFKTDIFDIYKEDDVTITHPTGGKAGFLPGGRACHKNECIDIQVCNIQRDGVCGDPLEALANAQCAFFVSIVVVQWADIIACKTRTLSLKHQGMRNGMLNFGLFFETVLAAILCYVPFLNTLGTRDLMFVHWLPAMPFAMLIFSYDEIRKYLMRNLPKGNWIEVNTYY